MRGPARQAPWGMGRGPDDRLTAQHRAEGMDESSQLKHHTHGMIADTLHSFAAASLFETASTASLQSSADSSGEEGNGGLVR